MARISVLLVCLWCSSISTTIHAQTKLYDEQWRWKLFTKEEGLPSHRVFDVIETQDGTIWASTQNGLAWFNGYYWTAIRPTQGLPNTRIRQIEQSSDNTILVQADSTLYRGTIQGFTKLSLQFDGHTFPTHAIAALPTGQHLLLSKSKLYLFNGTTVMPYKLPSAMMSLKFKHMFRSADGVIWVNAPHGLYRLDANGWTLVLSSPNSPLFVDKVASDTKGGWLASVIIPKEQRGVWECQPKGQPVLHNDKNWDFTQNICSRSNGDMLVISSSNSIFLRMAGVWRIHDIPPRQMQDLLFIKFRTNGDIWVGTESGLYLYRASSTRWNTWSSGKSNDRNAVNEILVTRDSSIWIARALGVEIHHKNGTVESIEEINGTPLGSITALAEDKAGTVWIGDGVSMEGAYSFDGSQWVHYGRNEGLNARTIHKILPDRRGRLWFLGLDGYDTTKYNPHIGPGVFILENGKITQWKHSNELPCGRVYAFAESRDSAYWFGTYNGISRWKNGRWTHLNIPNGLRAQRIFTIAIDSQNRVWFGDQHNGLGCITNDTIRYVTTADGLVSDAVQDIKVDSHNKLWISTNGGLSSYFNGWWETFNAASGLSNSRLWPLAITEQKIYIGSSGGGVIILNREIEKDHPPRVVFEIPAIEHNTAIVEWKPFSYFAEFSSKDIETRYRIDNGPFSPWSTNHQVIATDLSPGEHILQVHVKEILHPMDEIGHQITFTVPYPLHKNPYVLWPIGILVIGIVTLIYTASKRRRQFLATLKDSEEKFRTLIESMSEGVMHVNNDDVILFVNERICEMLGYESHEILGKIGKELFFTEEDKRIIDQKNQLRRHNVADMYQVQIRKKSGDLVWVEISGAPRHDHFGTIIGSVGIITDITERKRAEENLSKMHQLFQKTFHANPDASILTKLPDRRIVDANAAFEAVFGFARIDVIGKSITELNLWVNLHERQQALQTLNESGKVRDLEFEFRTSGGTKGYGIFFAEIIEMEDEQYVLNNIIDITKRQQIENDLKHSYSLLAATLESTADGILVVGLDGSISSYNTKFLTLWNIPADIVSQRDDRLFLDYASKQLKYPEAVIAKINILYSTPDATSYDEIEFSDGRVFERYSIPQRFGEAIIGRVWSFHDITERKVSGLALRVSEERKKGILESALDGIITIDGQSIILEFNPAAERIFKYSSEDVVGKKLDNIIIPNDLREGHRSGIEHYHHTGEAPIFGKRIEMTALRADGEEFPVELTVTKVMGLNEEIFTGFVRDITERKQAEEALQRSEEQFRLIAENTPDLITIHDTSGNLIYASPAYRTILGEKKYLNRHDAFANIHSDDRQNAKQYFQTIMTTGENQQMDFRLLAADGSVRYVESSGSAIKDTTGAIYQIILISRDVTEKRHIEEQLLRSQRMESIGTLASGIAHDLNNILTPILLSIDLLRRTSTDERSKRMLDMLEGSANRGASIVKQVLTFARGADGVLTTVHIEHILSEIQKIIHETFLKSIEIHIDVQPNIPTITADPTQIYQVLLNLCVNARDAMPNGGLIDIHAETVYIDEHSARMQLSAAPGMYVVIHVKDEGTGIPADVIDRIFEPFFTTKEVGKGTGLGLSTVFAIIKNHNGFVNVESEVGKGTMFSIYLPSDALTEQSVEIEQSLRPKSSGQTILVVDDEAAILDITVSSLIDHGYSILSAGNGVEALEVFKANEHEIALVITDMVMPVMDGPALINELHAINPHLKIIGVSGLKQYGDVAQTENVKFIHKPYTLEKLIATITSVL